MLKKEKQYDEGDEIQKNHIVKEIYYKAQLQYKTELDQERDLRLSAE